MGSFGFQVRSALFILLLGSLGINSAIAAGNHDSEGAVFVSANSTPINAVHMYTVSIGGGLSEVPGSPFQVIVPPAVGGSGSGPGAPNFPDEAFPLDLAIGNKGRMLYQLTVGPTTVSSAQVHALSINPANGQLTPIGVTDVGTAPLNGQMGMAAVNFE